MQQRYIGPDTMGRNEMMTQEEIKSRFQNEIASSYITRSMTWLPETEFVFAQIIETLKPYLNSGHRVLDLGAGTGRLSRFILEHFPNVNVHIVDFSENMLSAVPDVLKDFPGQFEIKQANFFDTDFDSNAYNAVVSSFAIHHGRSDETYRALYKNIYASLRAGGIFICCDVISGDNATLSAINEAGWQQYLSDNEYSQEEIEQILSNYHVEDSPISASKHLKYLENAGFAVCDFVWKKYNFGVYLGIKEL